MVVKSRKEDAMLPEEKARVKIDKQLRNAGWDIISRNEYLPNSTTAVKEALMVGNTESDYLLFVDGKAIAVVEAKREENPLGDEVKKQAEDYAVSPQSWYALWFEKLIPLVYMANGNKIYFKNMLVEDSEYEELSQMHSPKKMLQIIGKKSEYGALPLLEKRGLRDCQYKAETKLEESLKLGNKKNLAVLATGSGKTYLACLASYRLLNYTQTKRILFLADRNNLAKQALSEFSLFDRKVLLVANENEILRKNDNKFNFDFAKVHEKKDEKKQEIKVPEEVKKYLRIKEKTISDTIQFNSDYEQAVIQIIREFDNCKLNNIFERNEEEYRNLSGIVCNICKKNLRTFIFAIQKTTDIIDKMNANEYEDDFYECLLKGVICLSANIKADEFPKWEGNDYLSTKLGSNDMPLMRFAYDYTRWQTFDW